MPVSARNLVTWSLGLLMLTQTACNLVPREVLRKSQLRAQELYDQNQAIAAEKQQLAEQNASLQRSLEIANRRVDNLKSERSKLHSRVTSLIDQAKSQPSPLSDEATRRFEEMAEKYPGFDFDPMTGVSKFGNDILFDTGSAQIKSQAKDVLNEFADIMNEGSAQQLKILVVGHTDDQPIARSSTRAKHPTNWHLSTDRANSVILALKGMGVQPKRMGAAGYSKYQPLVPNKDAESRRKNRRVEIFVLAPDAAIAGGWDEDSELNVE